MMIDSSDTCPAIAAIVIGVVIVESSIAQEVRATRLGLGMTIKEFADRLDVSPSIVAKWEAGDRIPRSSSLKQIRMIAKVREWRSFDLQRDFDAFHRRWTSALDALLMTQSLDEYHRLDAIRDHMDAIRTILHQSRDEAQASDNRSHDTIRAWTFLQKVIPVQVFARSRDLTRTPNEALAMIEPDDPSDTLRDLRARYATVDGSDETESMLNQDIVTIGTAMLPITDNPEALMTTITRAKEAIQHG